MTTVDQDPVLADARTWLQEGPPGGVDVAGVPAPLATAVNVQGVAHVRNVPALAAAANSITLATATTIRLVGAAPQRRALTIITDASCVIAPDQGTAQANLGLLIPANTPVVIQSACEIWVRTRAAAEVTYWAEIDKG